MLSAAHFWRRNLALHTPKQGYRSMICTLVFLDKQGYRSMLPLCSPPALPLQSSCSISAPKAPPGAPRGYCGGFSCDGGIGTVMEIAQPPRGEGPRRGPESDPPARRPPPALARAARRPLSLELPCSPLLSPCSPPALPLLSACYPPLLSPCPLFALPMLSHCSPPALPLLSP